ncbi:sigma factor-like helix-turn-helix DNA-binding protein [Vibrio sp. PP-XX7]
MDKHNLRKWTDSLIYELEADIEENPAILIEHEQMLTKAVEAMDSLSDDTQSMLQMIVDDNCSYQDTADKIGVPIGTIRSRLSRAWQILKRCLD